MPAAPLDRRSKYLRRLVIDAFVAGKRGHIGAAFSLIEILRVVYDDILSEKDRCILSKGHGCLALYAVLADKGFFPKEELLKFCHFGSMLGGHPDPHIPGVEVATGSLGHGLSLGVGFAMAARIKKEKHRIFVIVGDGEINEGSIWEAALSAGHHGLNNLVVIVDYNHMQSYGPTKEILDLDPLADKWKSFGFATTEVDGHDVKALKRVLKAVPFDTNKPSALICHTVKGKGLSFAEQNAKWHHRRSVGEEEIKKLYEELEDVRGI